jgi:NADH-quinone oxidoreductase subunit J
LIVGAAGLSLLLFLAGIHWVTGAHSLAGPSGGAGSNVEKLARSLFTTYLLPFEVTSVLLVIAVVGAVVLSRRPSREAEPPEEAGRAGRKK